MARWLHGRLYVSGECRIPVPGSEVDEAAVYAAGALAIWLKFNIQAHPPPNDLQGLRRVPPEQQVNAIDRAEQILRARWADVEALAIRLLNGPDGFVPIPFAPDYSKSVAP